MFNLQKIIAAVCVLTVFSFLASCSKPKRIDQSTANPNTEPSNPIARQTPSSIPSRKNDNFPSESNFSSSSDKNLNRHVEVLPPTEINGPYVFHDVLGNGSSVQNFLVNTDYTMLCENEFYMTDGSIIMKFDLKSGAYLPACTDPGCTHKQTGCISYRLPKSIDPTYNKTILHYADGESLYFSIGRTLYKYDLLKASLGTLVTFSENVADITKAKEYGGYLYLEQSLTAENGSFERILCKISMSNGKITQIHNFKTAEVYLFAIMNGRMYFCENNRIIYSTDTEFSNRKTHLETDWLWRYSLADGKIIYSTITELWEDTRGFKSCDLRAVYLNTEKTEILSNDRVVQSFVTEKYIYYIPRFGNAFEGYSSYSLMRIDHDGKNKTEVMKITNVRPDKGDALMYFMIVGDYMIGYSGMSNKFYCYDLTTGAYTQIASDVKWYRQNWKYSD